METKISKEEIVLEEMEIAKDIYKIKVKPTTNKAKNV